MNNRKLDVVAAIVFAGVWLVGCLLLVAVLPAHAEEVPAGDPGVVVYESGNGNAKLTVGLNAMYREAAGNTQGYVAPAFMETKEQSWSLLLAVRADACENAADEGWKHFVFVFPASEKGTDSQPIGMFNGDDDPSSGKLFHDLCEAGKNAPMKGGV